MIRPLCMVCITWRARWTGDVSWSADVTSWQRRKGKGNGTDKRKKYGGVGGHGAEDVRGADPMRIAPSP